MRRFICEENFDETNGIELYSTGHLWFDRLHQPDSPAPTSYGDNGQPADSTDLRKSSYCGSSAYPNFHVRITGFAYSNTHLCCTCITHFSTFAVTIFHSGTPTHGHEYPHSSPDRFPHSFADFHPHTRYARNPASPDLNHIHQCTFRAWHGLSDPEPIGAGPNRASHRA